MRSEFSVKILVCVSMVSMGVATAWAYIPIRLSRATTVRWDASAFPLVYHLNERTSADLPNITAMSSPVAAVDRALLTWKGVSSAATRFAPLELSSVPGIAPPGGPAAGIQNLITFLDTPENRELVGDSLATTLIEFRTNGRISKTTTVFNPLKLFSTEMEENTFDIQSVATHEIGHTLGADHTGVLSATMFQSTGSRRDGQRTLSSDDRAFLSDVYRSDVAREEFGALRGRVLRDGQPLFGAHVVAQDPHNTTVVSALTLDDGSFSIEGMPPGAYIVFAEPLDSPVTAKNLFGGLSSGFFSGIEASFPTTFFTRNEVVAEADVFAGKTTDLGEVLVRRGPPELNIAIAGRSPGRDLEGATAGPGPFTARPGEVFHILLGGQGLDRVNRLDQIRVIGPGLELLPEGGLLRLKFSGGTAGIAFLVRVSRESTPGLRTLWIRDGDMVSAFAGGLEILPPPDMGHTLHFPVMAGSEGRYTGIALANPSDRSALLTLTAFRNTGMPLGGVGIVNPVTLQLEAGHQSALLVEQIFKIPPQGGYEGWLEVSSNNGEITGFYLIGDRLQEYIDGADTVAPSKRLAFSGILQSATFESEMHLVNPDGVLWVDATLMLYDPSGGLLGRLERTMAPRSKIQGTVGSLFKVSNITMGHIEVLATRELSGGMLLGESRGGAKALRKRLAAFGAQRLDSSATGYMVPQYLAGGGYTAVGFVSNPTDTPLTVRITAVGESANLLGPVLERTIPAHGTLSVRPADLNLDDTAAAISEGYLWIETSTAVLAGGVLFQDLGGETLAGIPLLTTGLQEAVFSQVAVGVFGFFTGIACVNVGQADAAVDVLLYDALGKELARGNRRLRPAERFSDLVEELTGFEQETQGGYIRILSTQPVVCFGLVGSPNTLAGIPAQFPIKRQR